MSEHLLVGLSAIVILGIGAQWLAWRLRLPSILILLIFGFIVGPITGFLNPDELLGELLLPFVSISVAIILFEGGSTLKIQEFKSVGPAVLKMITIGAAITWIIGAVSAHYLLNLNWPVSILLGAVLIVTGPTVIGPLLRHIRPTGRVSNILKWEGIVIDPVGALLAVLVFEAILIGEIQQAGTVVALGILKTIFLGGGVGILFAITLVFFIKRYWIPDFLQETVTLMTVILTYVISDLLQAESGLFAVTLMGMVVDNQKLVTVKHIVEFKENLRVLIISVLFIILAARLDRQAVEHLTWTSLIFLAVLILIVRPLAVYFSTIGSGLQWREKAFISWMAPRGIVAAAVVSIFAIRLESIGLPQTEYLVPLTFLVIVGTVTIYGLTSGPAARWLKVAQSNPQGVLMVGAHYWARQMAKILNSNGFKVQVIDTYRANIYAANMDGIQATYGSILSERTLNRINLDGIGRLMAMTSNDEVNALSVLHLNEVFEREELYQLMPEDNIGENAEGFSPKHLHGRFLFNKKATYDYLSDRFHHGAAIKSSKLSENYTFNDFKDTYGDSAMPLFLITPEKQLYIFSTDQELEPKAGQTLIAIVDENNDSEERIEDH